MRGSSARSLPARGLTRLARALGTLSIALALVACGETAAPTEAPASPVDDTAPNPIAAAGCGSAADAREVSEDPSFELRASASGPYAPGQEGRFEIALTPRGNYHVNTQYPMTIRLQAPEGVVLPSAEIGADQAAEMAEPRARFQVPFTPSAAGQHRVTAEVDFAVCTPESCMPDCRMLAIVLPVDGAPVVPAGTEAPTPAAPGTATP